MERIYMRQLHNTCWKNITVFVTSFVLLTLSASIYANYVFSYGPTHANDTLWHIAQHACPNKNISTEKIMINLHHENPGAFLNQTLDSLKTDVMLHLASCSMAQQTKVARKKSTKVARPQPVIPAVTQKQIAILAKELTAAQTNLQTRQQELHNQIAVYANQVTQNGAQIAALKTQIQAITQNLDAYKIKQAELEQNVATNFCFILNDILPNSALFIISLILLAGALTAIGLVLRKLLPLSNGQKTNLQTPRVTTNLTNPAPGAVINPNTDEAFPPEEGDFVDATPNYSTQLDLARVYIDMGDLVKAKTLLEEIIQKGNSDQIAVAKALREKLQ